MYRQIVVMGVSVLLASGGSAAKAAAQPTCSEVDQAKQAYGEKLGALNLKDADVKASRLLAGTGTPSSMQQAPRQSVQQAPRQSVQQAPRQSVQEAPRQSVQEAPRQSVQEAPRQSVQEAPRQSVQEAPRQSVQQAPRQSVQEAPGSNLGSAKSLITEADAACRAGKNAEAARKANEALKLLK